MELIDPITRLLEEICQLPTDPVAEFCGRLH